jgi:hypothetical protein
MLLYIMPKHTRDSVSSDIFALPLFLGTEFDTHVMNT